MLRERGHVPQKERDHDEPGDGEQGRPFDSEPLREGREEERTQREAKRAARDVDGHGESRACAAEPMRERGGGRMEGRAAKAAGKENQRQHGLRGRQADEAQHRHGEDWPHHHQDARTPRVREAAEPHLRHRRRNLVQHRQRACRGERQAESRDEERQEGCVDVAVTVHHEVGAGHQQHRRMQPFTKARQRVPLAATTLRSTRAVASSSSAILSARAEAISTPTPAAIPTISLIER